MSDLSWKQPSRLPALKVFFQYFYDIQGLAGNVALGSSGPLEKTYIESVPTSEFGVTTDIRLPSGCEG